MSQEITDTFSAVDVVKLQQELMTAKQQLEISDLRFQLQKTQAEKASRLDDSLFAPALYDHYQKVSEMLARSGVIPKDDIGKPHNIFVKIAMGYQLGFPVEQSLQDIAVINGRPCLWGDGLLALCLNHPDCEDVQETPIYTGNQITGYECVVKRAGHEPHTKTFTIQDAKRAKLWERNVWVQYPDRMMQMRARAYALRDKFSDALRGLRSAEVEQDDFEALLEKEKKKNTRAQTQKLKNMMKSNVIIENEDENNDANSQSNDSANSDSNSDDDNASSEPIDQATLDKILISMDEKGFDAERKKKALDYFKIKKFSELTAAQAGILVKQLGIKL